MDFQETINHTKDLLRQSLSRALKFIVPQIKPESGVFNDIIHLEGRYNHIEEEFNKGIIDSQEKELVLNQIRTGILNILDGLSGMEMKLPSPNNDANTLDNSETLLEKLRESIVEVEKLKAENQILKTQDKKHKLKIIIQCVPEINNKPNDYSCQCIILDDNTGESIEREIPLRKEPGGIIATIHDINPSDYIQIRIKDNEKEWESEYFSPQFLTQILRLV